ncbi:MAG: NUDIX domain-containing protein [Nocardioidaceae bacterium]
MQLSDSEESWPVSSHVDLHRDDWVMALRADTVSRAGSTDEFPRLVLEHPGAVAVLAVDADDQVLVLHQYRHPVQQRLVELPAGLMDLEGEPLLETAKRELAEEAQLAALRWTVLLDILASPGISSEAVRIYLAEGLTQASAPEGFLAAHEEADMSREWVPLRELVAAVQERRVKDALIVCAALALWAQRSDRADKP